METSLNTSNNIKDFISSNITDMFDANAFLEKIPYDGIIGLEIRRLIETVLSIGLSYVLACTGLVANSLAIATFAKLGYQDTTNISMSFICGWDLFRCFLGAASKLYAPFELISPVLSRQWFQYGMASIGYLAIMAGYVSTVLTAFVAVERCLCVTLPLKVKSLLTPRAVLVNNMLLSLTVVTSFVPSYLCIRIGFFQSPEFNVTLPVMVYSTYCQQFKWPAVYMTIITTTWLWASVVVIGICTALISFQLRRSSEFKAKIASSMIHRASAPKQISGRDKQITKMLLVIVALNLCTSLPRIVLMLCRFIFPEFDVNGTETNAHVVIISIVTTFEFLNYNTSLLVFYRMSSQFKAKFKAMFCHCF